MRLSVAGILCAYTLLNGCASDSGVIDTGFDTYKVSRRSVHGYTHPGMLVADAESEAGDYCRKHDGVAVITAVQESPPPFLFGNYPTAQVRFFCRTQTATSAGSEAPKGT
jgi:hypothetical protein